MTIIPGDLPRVEQLATLKQPSLPSADYFSAVSSVATAARKLLPSRMMAGGANVMDQTSALYGPIALCWAHDSYQEMRHYQQIGDRSRAVEAAQACVISGSLSIGSFVSEGEMAVQLASNRFTSIANSLNRLEGALDWIASGSFFIYYVCAIYQGIQRIRSFYRGSQLREELLQSRNPKQLLEDKIKASTVLLSNEELRKIAMEGGAKWLQEFNKKGAVYGESIPLHNSAAVVEQLVANGSLPTKGKPLLLGLDSLAWVGSEMVLAREKARHTAEIEKLIGPKAMKAFREGGDIKEALKIPLTRKELINLSFKVLSLLLLVGGAVLTKGGMVPILKLVSGLKNVASFFLSDARELIQQVANEEVDRRDGWVMGSSLVLNIVALGLLAASTGGVGLVVPLIITITWFLINCHGAYKIWRYHYRPWDAVTTPTLPMVYQLTRTGATEEKIKQVVARMSQEDRDAIGRLGSVEAFYREKKGQFHSFIENLNNPVAS